MTTLQVLSEAHAVALRAKCGTLSAAGAVALGLMAEGLPAEDPVRRDVAAFVAAWPPARFKAGETWNLGEALQRAVIRHLWAPLLDRVDVNG